MALIALIVLIVLKYLWQRLQDGGETVCFSDAYGNWEVGYSSGSDL